MTVRVRYFASLRETLGRDSDILEVDGPASVATIWQIANAGVDLPDNLLSAVNQEYVPLDSPVADGDEVAFFPPVTGG